jgi:hypothetical protein
MKKLLVFISFIVFTVTVYSQESPSSYSLNFKGGLFLTGPGKPKYGGSEFELKASPLFKADLDGILVPKLSMGLFCLYTPMQAKNYDQKSNLFSVGMTIKPRFSISESAQIRPGIAIGYNHIKNDEMKDPSNGLNVGFQLEISKWIQDNLGVVGEIGFVSQPVGGDGSYDLTFPPIFYVCFGIEFGK